MIRARPFGRPGDSQEGIDLLAEMRGGDVWDFQCKRVQSWGPEQTRRAIAAYKRDAARRFLLVTCDASEECHRVLSKHPGWALWDAREINRRFRELGSFEGARILFTHFGPGWAEAFFGVSGNGPLIGAEAKFQQQLREGVRFHHRHALIGREPMLRQLDDFVENEKARVFLLIGRGGLGKSRMLLEWSRALQIKHPGYTLRFVFDKNADFGPALRAAPPQLMLVFDDAHRLDDVRQALFPELANRPGIKLVLSLRPGPLGQVRQELLGSGFDTTDIIPSEPEPMKSLTGEQAMALVEKALKPEFLHLRHYLHAASRDCPLVAVIGAELINSGALLEADLRLAADVRTRVFTSLLDDAEAVRREFGTQETDDFLRLLALLGPLKCDAAFFEKAAPFLDLTSADRVSRLRDALDVTGLLLTTGAGTRVTPDLLSDHLAYDACYDATGQSRNFAERLLNTFSAEDFPKLMQHLAEAEWQAFNTKSDASSVVEPLWNWFRARFESSPFHQRREQIHQWGNIAHLQPERTLQLAELALSLNTAPEPQFDWQREKNPHKDSIAWLPQMLGYVAEHHADFLGRCFDILWELGKNETTSFHNNQSHPLSVINDVIRFKHWKRLDVNLAALDWVQRLLSGDDWLRCAHSPGALFERFFHPLFATSIEVHESSGNTIRFGSVPLHLPNSASIRERVRGLCRSVLARKDARLASQLIPTLEKGCDIARWGLDPNVPESFRTAWDGERLKCLAIIEEMATDFPEPLIHFQIRRALMRDLRYGKDSPGYRDACRKAVESLPDTLDFRIARAAFGNYYEEFERDTDEPDWHTLVKAKWETFSRAVAERTHDDFPIGAWLDHLAELNTRWCGFPGFQPNFRAILMHIATRHPDEALAASERLLGTPAHALVDTFDVLAMTSGASRRVGLVHTAAASESEMLRAAAVACCSWWGREGDMPEEAWRILESLALNATPLVADRIASFVWWNHKAATIRDWHLLAALPFEPNQAGLASNIAARAADLVADHNVQPDAESVARFIARFETLETVEGHEIEGAFEKLAEAFPVPVFLTLWRRNEIRKAGNRALKTLPYDFHRIPFRDVMNAPEVVAIVADFERRALAGESLDFDELRLLRQAIQQGSDDPSAWLETAVLRATTEEHLDVLRQLGSDDGNPALAYPNFARALLVRARAISLACHESMFTNLTRVGGGRGSVGHEPDDEWKALLESIERLAHQYAGDPELGPLFSKIAKHERSWMDSERRRSSLEDDE